MNFQTYLKLCEVTKPCLLFPSQASRLLIGQHFVLSVYMWTGFKKKRKWKISVFKNTFKPTVTELHLCESSGVSGSSSVTAAVLTTLCVSQLSVHRGQLQAASGFLHQAVVLAHQTHNNQAIIYTYSLVTSDL